MNRLFQSGDVVNSRWTVERFLGEGAFAQVYRVRHRIFGRQAMKVFKRVGMGFDEVEELLEEAVLLAQINHPHIIRVFDADSAESDIGHVCFFTTEYVAGGTLDDLWKSYGNEHVPLDLVIEVIRQSALGLGVGHKMNPAIVHRDVKPQNILIGYDEHGVRARIADFGLAKKLNPLTDALTGLGTIGFRPPEVILDIKSHSIAGDIWALGVCLYLLLTDEYPYDGDFGFEAGLSRFEKPLSRPSKFNIRVSRKLDSITLKCLAINSKDRYENGDQLAAALQTCQREEEPSRVRGVRRRSLAGEGGAAQKMVSEAMELARVPGQLQEAADLMEEVFLTDPQARELYQYKVALWRKGISG